MLTLGDIAHTGPHDFYLHVYGAAQPAGSKRSYPYRKATGRLGVRVTDDATRGKPWRQAIVDEAVAARADRSPIAGPVLLNIMFIVSRPKAHYRTGRFADQARDSAPRFPFVRPDVTKLIRLVEDALTEARVWLDDAQVVEQHAMKVYGDPPRMLLRVSPVTEW